MDALFPLTLQPNLVKSGRLEFYFELSVVRTTGRQTLKYLSPPLPSPKKGLSQFSLLE